MPELTAKNLKSELWETLKDIRSGKIEPAQADSVATQAREILRTTNTQLKISHQSKRPIPSDLLSFSEE